jgi:hypothetical protein
MDGSGSVHGRLGSQSNVKLVIGVQSKQETLAADLLFERFGGGAHDESHIVVFGQGSRHVDDEIEWLIAHAEAEASEGKMGVDFEANSTKE